jgi:hypothetical protein
VSLKVALKFLKGPTHPAKPGGVLLFPNEGPLFLQPTLLNPEKSGLPGVGGEDGIRAVQISLAHQGEQMGLARQGQFIFRRQGQRDREEQIFGGAGKQSDPPPGGVQFFFQILLNPPDIPGEKGLLTGMSGESPGKFRQTVLEEDGMELFPLSLRAQIQVNGKEAFFPRTDLHQTLNEFIERHPADLLFRE